MKKTKINISAESFPKEIRNLFEGVTVYDSSCSSDAAVYYLDNGYYIKTDEVGCLRQEANMTKLFYSIGLGVEPIAYISANKDYLITRAAIGEDLTHYLKDPEKLCRLLASALLNLHSQDASNVPVSSRYQRYLDTANLSDTVQTFDEFVLIDRYRIRSKDEALEIIKKNKNYLCADTLIHGDACLPNIIQNNGVFSSFIDFNMSGVGDKHIDLYWAIWSLQYNLKTSAYTDMFLNMYGRDKFSEDMLRVIAAFEVLG